MKQSDEPNAMARRGTAFWIWALAALAPGLYAWTAGALGGYVRVSLPFLVGLVVFEVWLFLPLPALLYLLWLGDRYASADHSSQRGRAPFVVGFWLLNLLAWAASGAFFFKGFH